MMPSSGLAALAALCRPNGIVTEVIRDELGLGSRLSSGARLSSIVTAASKRQAAQFLRAAGGRGAAMDWQLQATLPSGVAPLFFSGAPTGEFLLVIADKEPMAHRLILGGIGSFAAGEVAASEASGGLESARMLEILAHDLRNPISGILSASQFLKEDAEHHLESHHMALLNSIESSSGVALRVIEDILELPGIEPQMDATPVQPADLARLVNRSVEMNQAILEGRRIQLDVRIASDLPAVAVDPMNITRVINGLLTNTVRNSQPGSTLELRATAHPPNAILMVRGEGNRKHAAGWNEARSALTLASVQKIVQANHGSVHLEANDDCGTAFILTLPLSGRATSRPAANRNGRRTKGRLRSR
jgi:signal transduction histidine kinase